MDDKVAIYPEPKVVGITVPPSLVSNNFLAGWSIAALAHVRSWHKADHPRRDHRGTEVVGSNQRARAVHVYRHPVPRPTTMADVHQVRPWMPQDLWRALFPLPAMSRTEVRLPEGPACHAARRKDREPFA